MKQRKGTQGVTAIKIDLEKAYDQIKWGYLRQILNSFGLGQNLIEVVMYCLSSSSLRVLLNGEQLDTFKPIRGLRQGDPFAPCIFVLCMETLGQSITESVQLRQ